MSKNKIEKLVDDKEFAERWIAISDAKKMLKKLQVFRDSVSEFYDGKIYLKSDQFSSDDSQTIDSVKRWHISYNGRVSYNEMCNVELERLKQLKKFGWIVNSHSQIIKDDVDCGCWGWDPCECEPMQSNLYNSFSVILWLHEEEGEGDDKE